MASYFDDHNIREPKKRKEKFSNPETDFFLNYRYEEEASTEAPYDFTQNAVSLASVFEALRDNSRISGNAAQQTILDNLVTQLLDEAYSNAKGNPPASKRFISNLPTVKVDDKMKDNTCSICVENFKEKEKIYKLPCFHCFHAPCIVPWLKLHNTCPICRSEYETDDPEYEKKRKAKLFPPQEDSEEEWDPFYG